MMKKLVAMLLMLVLCMGLAVTASADQTGTTGACTWSFDEATGTLTISGSGAMADYSSSNNPPWASFKDSIQTIVINEGVTTIGNRAFPEYPALTEVFISGSVKAIGNNAFYSCSNLKTVEYWGITAPTASSNAFGNTSLWFVKVPDNYSDRLFGGKMARKSLGSIDSNATYNISISASPAAGGTVTGTGTYHAGQVAITAAANPGYRFVEWRESDSQISTDSTYILTANRDYTIVAVFEQETTAPTTYTVTLPTGTGYTATSVEGSSSPVDEGGSYSFTVTISDGYRKGSGFAVKTNDTLLTEQDGKYTISNINENQNVTVEGVEEIPSYTVSISVNPAEGGTVTAQVNGTSVQEAAEGDTVTLNATANDGYRFKEWTVVSGGAAIENNQFTMPGCNVEVTAVFERVYRVIIASDIQNGTLEADKYFAAADEPVTLTATPATGYMKGQYTTTLHGEGAIGLSGDTLTMPACDVTVSVTFLPIETHTVWRTSQPGLKISSGSHPFDQVPDGETYTFTVTIHDGYEKTEGFKVTVNGEVVTPGADGVYAIPNVTADLRIEVSGVYPCRPDSDDDFVTDSSRPFVLACTDETTHTYPAPYYSGEYITNIGAVYGNVNNAAGWRCDVTFDVEKYAAANNHRITTQTPATASFTLKWDTSAKKWAYVNETVTYDITCAPTLTGIEVTTQPKLDYSEGDALDLSAMVITASWSNNSTTELSYADVTASIANGTTLAKAVHNGEVITVTYNGQTAQTNALSVKSGNTGVSVVAVKSVAGTIEGNVISVVLPYGNNLADLTSDDFTVTLADSAANVTVQPASNDGGATWLFTVTAENGTTQVYTVNVSIGEDPDAPDKTDVSNIKLAIGNHNWTVAQETANTSEAVKAWIETTLANSNLNGVTASKVTITAITPAVAGDMYNLTGTNGSFSFTVKLSKGNVTDTVEITTGVITATAYSGNTFVPVTDISGVPTSTTAGTPLTLTGIVEPGNATYTTITWSVKDAGTTGAAISDNILTATTAGEVIVTATIANGKSATEAFTKDFTITVRPVPVVLTGIVVTTAPTKTVYTEGESFDPAGMVVTANYSDGSSKAVTGYALSPNGALTTANTTVTVTYMENGITKTASQVISVNAKPAATYTVTFDSNGGSGTMVPQTFTEGVAQNLTLNAFTREGFTFIGWNTAADGSSNSFADGASVTASGNATLYAQWQKNAAAVYTVTVSNDGNGTGTAVPSSGVTGTEVEITVTPNSGYRFKEWQVISGDVTVTGNKLTIGTANVEVKAIFELIPAATYTVTFDPNGGSGMMAPQTFTEGVAQNLTLNTFTREGFTFNGWNTTADGSGTSFADGASVTASSNATLYAQWKAVPAVNPLTITKQPTDQFVVEGQRAEFSVEATGDGLSYQWYINRNDGRGWRELDGAIGTAYVTSVTDLECDGFQYGCLITDQYGNTLKSDVAVLHVSKVPVLPETGDSSTPMLWLAMSILSMAGILLLRKKAYSR